MQTQSACGYYTTPAVAFHARRLRRSGYVDPCIWYSALLPQRNTGAGPDRPALVG
ncbi:MAG TPA: hypothetical protein IAB89_05445 [Candidatus Caccousia avicola]|uniref:Uncharacterized protein n=1 Tax=Candidatus Caccousia avicola TaxID=2840721 RepID=A0A9D1AMD5_9FIRM|nr:hypothetical protein [Candidatus Caccousia avicola]